MDKTSDPNAYHKNQDNKLMRLGSPNQIVVDSDFKAVDFDCRITSIRILTFKIESQISISIQNQSIFDINCLKLIYF